MYNFVYGTQNIKMTQNPIFKKINKNHPLKKIVTLKVGGPAKWFFVAKKEDDLINIINWAKEKKIKKYIIGDGSNLVPNDNGFNGLVIKNSIKNFNRIGDKVFVGSGDNLLKFILKLNKLGLAGIERMAGIPGTVGGAIYGCSGAYGQEIKDTIIRVKIFDDKKIRWLSKKQCCFGYRKSVFKNKKNWIILEAEFKLKKYNFRQLKKCSKEIIKMRSIKYPSGLLCPGSFFKNIVINDIKPTSLRRSFIEKIDKSKINHGKLPSGYLLESVGARGMQSGKIKIAKHHGNLIYNTGYGTASDIKKLAKILKLKVWKKFGIRLEEEIQYL